MNSSAHKPLNLAAVAIVAAACLPILLVPTAVVPYALLALGLLAIGIVVVHTDGLLKLLLAWLAAASVFTLYFRSWEIPGFFTLTIDRVMLAAIAFLFLVGLLLGRVRLQWPPLLGLLIVALVAWCAISAQVAGWTVATGGVYKISPPYYRFFVGFLFPAIVFFMAASLVRTERHIRAVLVFFTLFGVYLTFTGLAENYGWRSLVWPQYILRQDLGIHTERVRGPFLNSPDMGLTLVICMFANLLLASRVRTGWALLVLAVTLPMPLVIFATKTRSIWLAAVACSMVAAWAWPRAKAIRYSLSMVGLAALVLLVFSQWDRLSTSDRDIGGLADMPPILNRVELAQVSVELAGANPLTGVGLGRFQLAAPQSEAFRRVGSRAVTYGWGAVEHNNFLSMLAETGIPGALLYAAVIFGLLFASIRLYRMIPPTAIGLLDRRFVTFFWIVWVAFFIDSMFRLTTSSPFPNGMFLLMGGVIVGYCRQLLPQPVRPPRFARPSNDRPIVSAATGLSVSRDAQS